jgi:hypothetical protein
LRLFRAPFAPLSRAFCCQVVVQEERQFVARPLDGVALELVLPRGWDKEAAVAGGSGTGAGSGTGTGSITGESGDGGSGSSDGSSSDGSGGSGGGLTAAVRAQRLNAAIHSASVLPYTALLCCYTQRFRAAIHSA